MPLALMIEKEMSVFLQHALFSQQNLNDGTEKSYSRSMVKS